jgi:hypothetical protein
LNTACHEWSTAIAFVSRLLPAARMLKRPPVADLIFSKNKRIGKGGQSNC